MGLKMSCLKGICSKDLVSVESSSICHFVSGLRRSAWRFLGSSTWRHASLLHSFSRLNTTPRCGQTTFSLSATMMDTGLFRPFGDCVRTSLTRKPGPLEVSLGPLFFQPKAEA
ncbi:uncharacterized protein C16orf74 homolog isoform X1 [Trachypithecus francoisi]|uniref:uncharacterized protein C16orf74 homolog isoform X1 n=1 Tax=Trachypithecus francoisi TaxID=54180 RepID=UPI00141B7D44|nr:uncharacterized protein C16orf74 homolog isoform X1 [Trachypithecus francoisi]